MRPESRVPFPPTNLMRVEIQYEQCFSIPKNTRTHWELEKEVAHPYRIPGPRSNPCPIRPNVKSTPARPWDPTVQIPCSGVEKTQPKRPTHKKVASAGHPDTWDSLSGNHTVGKRVITDTYLSGSEISLTVKPTVTRVRQTRQHVKEKNKQTIPTARRRIET
ncbi:uncharacterized protein BDZ83DRAFT_727578 [Colletotrichum acutatum]|uniref:Uncharacterized protein n=1 Tax=Glomerella acutata TaxID=27357 RepID=A0AAD8XKT5_GLOAC|nr:uncharacterized protein BDZ83DRAFT_727578 [Colletotrichum acutatum]KAK1729216.1 hypothetical protein BDZ83DRAFT_727578 [Colletotrichum acutatum]